MTFLFLYGKVLIRHNFWIWLNELKDRTFEKMARLHFWSHDWFFPPIIYKTVTDQSVMITESVTEKSSVLKWRVFLGFGLISLHRQRREFRPRLESLRWREIFKTRLRYFQHEYYSGKINNLSFPGYGHQWPIIGQSGRFSLHWQFFTKRTMWTGYFGPEQVIKTYFDPI